MIERLERLRHHLGPWAGVAFFLAGFVWDALTLVRVDRLLDNLLLGAYLAALSVLLVLEERAETAPEAWPRTTARLGWVQAGVQFFYGGLFSAYLVFYGRSASWGPSLAFVVVLAVLFVVNEFLHDVVKGAWLRLALHWLVTFAFLLYALPVVAGFASARLVVATALLASLATTLLALAMGIDAARPQPWRRPLALAAGLSLGLLGADRLGLVPPMPFAVVELGVFHGVERRQEPDPDGARREVRYWLSYDRPAFWALGVDDDRRFRQREGEAAHVFSAIFAPSGFRTTVVHRWQRWDEAQGAWVDRDRIDVTKRGELRGGELNGYRTWSKKEKLPPGAWRVLVETGEGRELARVRFEVLPGPHPPPDRVTRAWD